MLRLHGKVTNKLSVFSNSLFVKADLKKVPVCTSPERVTAGHAFEVVEQRRNATNPGITDDRLGSLT